MKRKATGNPVIGLVRGFVVLVASLAGPAVLADATLTGNCWVEKVKGRPGDYLALYEWNVWLSRDGTGWTGDAFRVGLPPQPNQAYYTFTAPAGTYSLYLDESIFWGRPKVRTNVVLPSSGTVNLNVELPTDYSCAFGTNSGPWGSNPWTVWSTPWYQTFIATGTSITGVDFKLSGTNASQMAVSIHSDNGGSITGWPQVGSTRTLGVGTLNDNWIRYRSGEIPTVPGHRYALRLAGINGSPNNAFSIFRRIDDGTGYAGGQAYNASGQAQNFDLYAMIFSDNDGTVIPYCAREYDGGDLAGWAGVWAQEVRAVGNGLAGATLYFAGGGEWHKVGTFKIRVGGPNGAQVGPAKSNWSGSMAADSAFFSASWNPGEVPLTPGQTYYIEVSSVGYNPSKFSRGANVYPYGDAYQSGGRRSGVDLHMQVVEYADTTPPPPPTIFRSPASFTRSVERKHNLPNDAFTVRNSGGSLLNYVISDDADWLAVDPETGESAGETDVVNIVYSTSTLLSGSYTGTITISAEGATNTPQTVVVYLTVTPPPFAPCDFNRDGDVDQEDFGRFQGCYSGPGIPQNDPSCAGARLDTDEDVDGDDTSRFLNCFAGPDDIVDTTCAD